MAFSPLLGHPKPQFFDNNGALLTGGLVEFYAAGTSTPLDTYTTSTGAITNSNPVVLNSRGEPPEQIHGTDGVSYKVVLKDLEGAVVWTIDAIQPVNSAGAASSTVQFLNATLEKNATYTVVAGDEGKLINCIANTFTITLLPASTATEGFVITIINTGDGVITIDGDAAELINGVASITLQPGEHTILTSTGSAWNGPHYIKGIPLADASGTVDAMAVDFIPNITLTDGALIQVKAVGQITSLVPTIAVDGAAAKTIVKANNTALVLTDIQGSDQTLLLQYDSTLDKWMLLNPTAIPVPGGALVYHDATQVTTTATPFTLAFNQEEYDTNTIHDTVTNNSRLTVPSGITRVRLVGRINWITNAGSGVRRLSISKNGAAGVVGLPVSSMLGNATDTIDSLVVSAIVDVVNPDYFELIAYQTSGFNQSVNSGVANIWFAMEIIE